MSDNTGIIIDCSHWQGKIAWDKVVNNQQPVLGVYFKATTGSSGVDPMLSANSAGASSNGLKIGYYHFASPILGDGKAEADWFIQNVKKCPIPT